MKHCFLDIDGTLLDRNYNINAPDFSNKILAFTQNNWLFHFNSNRSIEDMLPLYNELNLNGWLVCEGGSFGYQPDEKKLENILDSQLLKLFEIEKKVLHTRIKLIFKKLKLGKIKWLDVDTVKLLSSKSELVRLKVHESDYVLLNNCYRKYSASIHIKKNKDVTSLISLKLGNEIAAELQLFYKKENLPFSIVFSNTHGNLLINFETVSKRDGVKWIKDNFSGELFAIGDELSDYEMIKGLGEFYTTANAPDNIKALAKYVASNKYTLGVLEVLNKIS